MSHIDEGELTAYADGAFAPESAEAKRIAAHLSECARCRDVLAQAEAINVRARGILAVATPEKIVVPEFPKRRRVMIPLAWAASVALALGIGYWSLDKGTMRVAEAPQTPTAAVKAPVADQASPVVTPQAKPPVAVATKPARERREAAPAQVAAAPPPAIVAPTAAPAAEADAVADKSIGRVGMVPQYLIPGISVVAIRSAGNATITEQKLPDGTLITVTATVATDARDFAAQNLAEGAGASSARKMEMKLPEAVVTRGAYTIRVTGALSIDSLNALARKIK